MANVKFSAIASAGAIAGADTLIGVQSGTTDVQYTWTNTAAFFAAATNTLTNKTYDTAGTGNVLKINGTTVSAVTGTGSVVLATSPTLVTPTLGAATITTVNGNTITAGTGTLTLGSATLDVANVPLLNASTNAFTGTLLTISGGATLPTPVANTVLQIARGTSSGMNIELDGFTAASGVVQRRANTSSTAPSAITSANTLGNNFFQGWNTSAYVSGANIRAVATATTWDGTHNGAFLAFLTAPDGGGAAAEQLRIQGSGGLSVGNANIATDPGAGGVLATTVTVGAGAAITSSGAGGALGTNAFTSTAYLPLTGGTLSGNLTISGAGFITSGSLSAAAWTTNGVRTQMAAASYTDTSSSGTVANAYTDLFGAGTILASSATTYTSYYGAFFKAPVASTNVTMTNKSALGADTISIGGAAQSTFALAVTGTASISGALTVASLNGNTFTTGTYTLTGQAGKTLTFNGSITLTGTDAQTYTFPSATDAIVGAASTNTFTNKTYDTNGTGNVLKVAGIQLSAVTGSGNVVLATSAFLTTPNIGNASSSSLTSTGNIAVGAATQLLWTGRGILTSNTTGNVQYGATDAASPVAQTISFQSVVAGNANTAGATATIQSSLSNGNGGGDLLIKTTLSNAASGTQNTAATALTLKGGTQNIIAAAALTSASASGGVGYSTGAGGTVTQATSKSTGVTLNTTTGQITMNNANLAGQTEVSFTLTDSAIAATDVVLVTIASGATANSYVVGVAATASGSCVIQLGNVTLATTLGEAIVLNFVVIKGVTS